MLRNILTAAAALALVAGASAQTQYGVLHKAENAQFAGIYRPDTGFVSATPAGRSGPDVIWNNNALSNYYSVPGALQEWVDEGALADRGVDNNEQCNGFDFTYCSGTADATGNSGSGTYNFYDETTYCGGPVNYPTADCSYGIAGLPLGDANGNTQCWIVGVDLTGGYECNLSTDDANGKLLNAITKGSFRASSIVSVDEENGRLYFRGNGREKGNIYHEHTYRVNLDGSGLTLLDPGTATYRSSLSESKNYVVANGSRIDQAPSAVLNDANGRLIMELEKMDTSKLLEAGWKMPETFSVKAADGVTNLYGNMWKPFNFDAKKRYPIILHVYPGPQQEGVSHSFSAASSRQQLAQLGFIVIQVGHRGGTPTRSRAYANYGYYNLRDYGLADKKTAVEQLAQRHSFIDVERVGMYGHSGGGFMTAAALLQKPYNDFFKVGVSSAGNHDNNIYNHSWSEKYHGLKEVTADSKSSTSGTTQGSTRDTGTQSSQRGRRSGGDTSNRGESSRSNAVRTTSSTSNSNDDNDKKKLEIHVPTNAELAANLKGKLLLVHGEIDNNVHPANTMRLVDALIKANKRFDLLIIPGARHGFGSASTYFRHRMWEYFATHLIGDFRTGADILDK